MQLSRFIRQNHAEIAQAWEQFARELTAFAQGMSLPTLRDDLDAILEAVASDIEEPEDAEAQTEREKGEEAPGALEQIAAKHAQLRLTAGFNLRHVLAEYRALRASILRLYGESGGAIPDVGEVIRFNEAIDDAIAEILKHHERTVMQYTARFLAILAHDIRNPLNTIGLAAEALREQAHESAILARIQRGVRQANRLVDDLAIFVRSHFASTLPLTKAATDLRLLCEQVLEDARGMHADKSFNLAAQGNLTGTWDSPRLVQMMANLVGNAAIHSASPEVELAIHDDGPWVVIKITSQGNPIPPDKLDSIFDPLVRSGHGSGSSLSGGLGLGLFIVREIVSAHSGTVEVNSSEEAGTTFTIRLPRGG